MSTNIFDMIEIPMMNSLEEEEDQELFDNNGNKQSSSSYVRGSSEHRSTCHRCGNIRKLAYECTECPHVFCKGCFVKMEGEYGTDCFVYGCPVVSKYTRSHLHSLYSLFFIFFICSVSYCVVVLKRV